MWYNSLLSVSSFNYTFSLTGVFPFDATTTEQILINNENCIIEFPSKFWNCISNEAKHLVTLMTLKNPDNRLDSNEVLNHTWFTKGSNNKAKLSCALENMKKYSIE